MGRFSPYPHQVFVWKNQWYLLQLATKGGSLYVADLRQMFFFLPIIPSSLTAGEDRQKIKGLAAETFFLPIVPSSWLGELATTGAWPVSLQAVGLAAEASCWGG